MGKENKVSLAIFTLFLVYGVQGYFSASAFIIPFFLNKLFYLITSLVFLGIWILRKNQEISLLPPILLTLMSAAWVISDPYSTEFLAYTFNAYESFMIFDNFYLIILSLITFVSCLSYFVWEIFKLQKKGLGKILLIFLYGLTVFGFVASNPIWLKILLPINAILLAYSLSKIATRSSEAFSAWLNLVALLELLTLLIPDSTF
ncbi:MAG: hypothetical protein MK078_17695 [Crocinitomicaceae bacterium]|nr:hypothetical protein [Crocinitomicaceae bacterium]